MPRSPKVVRRVLVWGAIRNPSLGYRLANHLDHNGLVRWLRRHAPQREGAWAPPTYFRHLYLTVIRSRCPWPYPPVAAGPDPKAIGGSTIVATFHVADFGLVGAYFQKLPEPRVSLVASSGKPPPGNTELEVRPDTRVAVLTEAARTLRTGGHVLMAADVATEGEGGVACEVLGVPMLVSRGPFALSRLSGAPLLPIVTRWEGASVEIVSGDPIPPGPEAETAAALFRWLDGYLLRHPDDAVPYRARLARRVGNGPIAEGVLENSIADLSGL